MFYHAVWHDTDGLLQPDAVRAARTAEFFAHEIAKARTRPLIARDGKGIAGMVLWQGAFVQALYVRADHRGCGLGARLLARAEDRIGKTDAPKVALMCVAGNDRARTFYERQGYRQTMTRNVKVLAGAGIALVQAWRMEKRLKGTAAATRARRKT